MASIKKAVSPRMPVQMGKTAQFHPDKDEEIINFKANLSMAKNQQGTQGNSAASQRSRALWWLQNRGPLTTLQALRELDILRLAARIKELRAAGYPINTYWTNDITSEGNSHLVGKYVLSKTKQFSLLDLKGVRGVAA